MVTTARARYFASAISWRIVDRAACVPRRATWPLTRPVVESEKFVKLVRDPHVRRDDPGAVNDEGRRSDRQRTLFGVGNPDGHHPSDEAGQFEGEFVACKFRSEDYARVGPPQAPNGFLRFLGVEGPFGPEFPNEPYPFLPHVDAGDPVAQCLGNLYRVMTQTAGGSHDRDDLARRDPKLGHEPPHGSVRCHPGAHERRRLVIRDRGGNRDSRAFGDRGQLRESPVDGDGSCLGLGAPLGVAGQAYFAASTPGVHPRHADPVTGREPGDARPDRLDSAYALVSEDANPQRLHQGPLPRPVPLPLVDVAVTHSGDANPCEHFSGSRSGRVNLLDGKRRTPRGDDRRTHEQP